MCGRYEEEGNEIYPSEEVKILIAHKKKIGYIKSSWGFMIQNKIVFNAKSETLDQKKIFKNLKHCIIKADSYFEWDPSHHKVRFSSINGEPLYMAGLVRKTSHKLEHVIITTQPNQSVQGIHTRMPLILNKQQMREWLFDIHSKEILSSIPEELDVSRNSEQISLF